MARRDIVLIVEDDASVRQMYRTALGFAGFDVIEAQDGPVALHVLDHSAVDIVVLDIMLPTVSGLLIQQELAARGHPRSIPIVIVTGSDMNLDAVDVPCILRKPVSPEQLIAAVRNCLAAGASGVHN